ncbi:MAG: toprim domain-containing protein [Chitinophagaceae bacterium]|nr:toprim domain-containing protein [Chitinophagaceae bacterium]
MANLSFIELEQKINLLEFAIYNGYNLDKSKSTRRNPVLKGGNGDVLVLKHTDQNHTARYFNASEGSNTTDRGNVIEFVKHRIGSLFPSSANLSIYANVNKVLHEYLNIPLEQKQYDFNKIPDNLIKEFDVNLYGLKKLNTTNEYLNKIRGISQETINQEVFKNRIFLNNYKGKEYVVFPFYGNDNKTICGLNFKAENEQSKNALYSDKLKGVWTSKIPDKIETVFICEHPIDAISYSELYPSNNTLFVSTFGRPNDDQLSTLTNILEANATKINSNTIFKTGFDNDFSGQSFALQNANFFSIGNYFLTHVVDNNKGIVSLNIYNTDKLSNNEKQMLHINTTDGFSCSKIFDKINTKDNNVNTFTECASQFKIDVENKLGREVVNIKIDDKKLSVEAAKIPQVMKVLNESFNTNFDKLQVTKIVPMIPTFKDFNEDLKNKKSFDIKPDNKNERTKIKL